MAKSFEDEFRDALHESYQRVGSTDEAQEEERLHDARKIAHAILVLLDQAGFWLEGRLHLVDKRSGKHYR